MINFPSFRPGLWTGMFYRYNLPFEATTELLKSSGFACAELCESYCRQFMMNGFEHMESQIELTQCHAPSGQDNYDRLWPVLQYFNISCVVFHSLPGELTVSRDFFRKLVDDGGESGIKIAVENLIGTPGRKYEILLEQISGLGINIDSAHALANGDKPEELITYYGDRVYGVHMSDSDGEARDLHLRPGRGIADWQAIVAALKKIEYAGDFHLELPHERAETLEETIANATESCKATLRYLRENDDEPEM